MKHSLMWLILVAMILLSGCTPGQGGTSVNADAVSTAAVQPTNTLPPTKTAFYPPTATITPDWTATPTPRPTLEPVSVPAGTAIVPILLYHHVSENGKDSRYFVEPGMFEQQMQWLFEHGYQTVTATQLIHVIREGGELPARPVMITFDDGNLDVYQNAFPIMRQYGFVGVFYIVSNRLAAQDFVTVEQLSEMIRDGWEIGSHSKTHANLMNDHSLINTEAALSKSELENALGVSINTFAYPFGYTDEVVTDRVYRYGYLGAMGLGSSYTHTNSTIYYLSREEVRFEYTMDQFVALLPWQN